MSQFEVRPAHPHELSHVLQLGHLLSKPGFSPDLCRVGVLNGAPICYAVTGRNTLRYGTRKLRVVGLGSVYTLPPFRNRGYATYLVQDTLTYIIEQGAHLALLRDPDGFFGRFGFSPVWPEYYLSFSAEEAIKLESGYRLRPVQRQDIPHLADLYERHWGLRVSFQRSPESWIWRVTEDPTRQTLVALSPKGLVRGYISGDNLLDENIEVVADHPEAAAALMRDIAERRLHTSAGDVIRWLLPPDDALVVFARDLLDVAVSAYYHPAHGWMARLIDTPGFISALLPEISAQASSGYPEFDPGMLQFIRNPASIEIRISGRWSASCKLSYRDFIQLAFGSLTPTALRFRADLDHGALELLGALFPPRMAALGNWDWF